MSEHSHLIFKTSLPTREAVLKCTYNKDQLNKLLCEGIINDSDYLSEATEEHELILAGWHTVPVSVVQGEIQQMPELSSTHEEADVIIIQHTLAQAMKDNEARLKIICDDTDVFALLAYFYHSEKLTCTMLMESSVAGRAGIDIPASISKHKNCIPSILKLHALTGCDTLQLHME